MDNLEQNVDFIINRAETKANTEAIKQDIAGVGATAETAAQKVADSVDKITAPKLGLLERLKGKLAEYKESADKAASVTQIENYNAKIQDTSREITRLTNVGKVGFDDMGNAIKNSYERPVGTLNRLIALQDIYKRGMVGMSNTDQIAKYNRKLEETAAQITRVKNIGKAGFDELGNKIIRATGLQEQLNSKLRYFQNQLNYAKAPESFVALNRKIEELTGQLNRLSNAGKKGFDDLGNKVKETDSTFGKFLNTVKGIAAAIIAAFSIQAIKAWLNEAREMAARGEGIREAFLKLGDEKTLDKLRKATRGATSDIDLMAQALRARNFNIGPELLAKGLELAGKVSRQTGQDVTYLADSFVNGVGRKSLLILDNLQIAQVQLRAEMKKTGDFQTAVTNVITQKLKDIGTVNDTTADRMARWQTRIANFKEFVGQKINLVINYDALREANKAFMEIGANVLSLQKNMFPLIKTIDDLSAKAAKNGGVTKLNKDEQLLLKDAIRQVGNEIPSAITQMDALGRATGVSTLRAKEFIEQQVLVMKALNADRLKETWKDIAKVSREIRGMQTQLKEIQETGSYSVRGTVVSGNGASVTETIRKATAEEVKALVERNQALLEQRKMSKALYDSDSGKLLQDVLDARNRPGNKVDDGKAEAAAEKAAEKLKREQEKQQTADATALEAQKNLQQRILELKDKFARKGLSKEEEAREAIKAEFIKLAFDIEKQGTKYDAYAKKYGAARATKVLGAKETTDQIEPIRVAAIEDLTYRQGVERTKLTIEQEKKLYTDYEQFKAVMGDRAAKERYGKQIATEKTFLQTLKDRRDEILKTKTEDLTGGQMDYLDFLNKQVEGEEDVQRKKHEDILRESQTFEEAQLALKQVYQQKFSELQGAGNEKNRAQLIKAYQDQNDALITANIAKSDLSKKLAQEAIILTRSQVKEQIKALEYALKDPSISAAYKGTVQKQIGGLKTRLDIGVDQSNIDELTDRRNTVIALIAEESKKAKPEVRDLNKMLVELNEKLYGIDKNGDGKQSGLSKFMEKISDSKSLKDTVEWAGVAADGLNTMSHALEGVNDDAAYTLDTIAQLAGSVVDLGAAILSGDPAKMVGAAIKAVGTLFTISKKVKEMNAAARKEVADFYAQAISGEREYQELLNQRALQTIRDNKTALKGIQDEIELRNKQAKAYAQEAGEIMAKLQGMEFTATEDYEHGTWFKKAKVNKTYGSLGGKSFQELSQLLAQGKLEGDAKALVERLKELEQQGYDAEQALKDLAKQTQELFTGTTSDNITNSLLEMFKSGKTGAADLANFFKQTMDEAALSIFKNKVLAGAVDKFYEEFAKKSTDGDLTSKDYADLQVLYNTLTGDALKQFEQLKKLTGSDLKGSSGLSGVSGAVVSQALTEDTANLSLGIWRGQYDLEKQSLAVQKSSQQVYVDQLHVQEVIAVNTAAMVTAQALTNKKLDEIIENTKPSGSTLDQALRNSGLK